jgi:hypothetical protein
MPSFVFGLADLIAGTVAAVNVDAYQPNETGEWMEVDSVQIVDLPANPENAAEYLWTTELVDPTLSVRFSPVSAAGVHLTQGGIILPPQPTEPGMCNINIKAYTQTGMVLNGVTITIAPSRTPAIANGGFTSPDPVPYVTANGVVNAPVLAGPAYDITSKLLGKTITVETKDQVSVDVAFIASA